MSFVTRPILHSSENMASPLHGDEISTKAWKRADGRIRTVMPLCLDDVMRNAMSIGYIKHQATYAKGCQSRKIRLELTVFLVVTDLQLTPLCRMTN